MSDTTLTWNSEFGIPLSDYLRAQANVAVVAMANDGAPHAAAMRELGALVGTMKPGDPLLWVLGQAAQGARIIDGGDKLKPGTTVERLLQSLGTEGPIVPAAEITFRELLAAMVADAFEALEERARESRDQRQQTEARFNELELDAKRGAEDEVIELRTELEDARKQIAAHEDSLEYLQGLVGNGQTSKAKPRRTKVAGESNVYLAENGVDHEVGWREDGKRRWAVVGPDLTEAIRFRDEKQRQKEAVAA